MASTARDKEYAPAPIKATSNSREAISFFRESSVADHELYQPLRVQVVRIGEVPRAKALLVAVAGPPAKLVNARASILVKDLARLGVDCLLLDGRLDPEVTKAFEEAGIAPAVSFDIGRTVPEEGAATPNAGSLHRARGSVWVGSLGRSLKRWDGDGLRELRLPAADVHAVADGPGGGLLFLTSEGLLHAAD